MKRLTLWGLTSFGLIAALGGCSHEGAMLHHAVIPTGAAYVAMGSSFAAGPGVSPLVHGAPALCARSLNNYAQQLARQRGLALTDVSCSGATTGGVLEGWARLPAQIAALTPQTRLVTVTIGGNDVGYIGGLMTASCQQVNPASAARCSKSSPVTEERWAALESALRRIAAEVRQRSPEARLIWVDYPQVLAPRGLCGVTPLSLEQAEAARGTAKRLAALTARVARETGSSLLAASRLTAGHDACARDAWMNGYPVKGAKPISVPYHPTLPGMTAIAGALDRELGK